MKSIKIVEPQKWTEFIFQEAQYPIPVECQGGVVIDCGSNVGDFELRHGHRFEKYVCFDILDENIRLLHDNLEGLNLNYKVEKRACSDKPDETVPVYAHQNPKGELNYFGNSGNAGTVLSVNSDNSGWLKDNKIDEAPSITIEEITKKHSSIKLLKCDIEGGEYSFLLNKDLSIFEYIAIEIHFEEEQRKSLVDFICKTHDLIHNATHVHIFKLRLKK